MRFYACLYTTLYVTFLLLTAREASARGLRRSRTHHTQQPHLRGVDFISSSLLSDGEVEVRAARGDVVAMETVAPGAGEHGLRLREVSNGKVLLQSVYGGPGGDLSDCDISTDAADVEEFRFRFTGTEKKLTKHVKSSRHASHIYYKQHHRTAGVNLTLFDAKSYRLQKNEHNSNNTHHILTNLKEQKKQCRRLHALLRQYKRDIISQSRGHTQSLTHGERHRAKRAMLIYPGTNWCGAGSVAQDYHDLGLNINTDKCCREHDHCPYTIESFQSNYNIFNYRFHTLSHCGCDKSFKACLKAAGNDVAHMVGRIFFNVVKMRCFNFKSEKTCVKRSWWGKCLRYEKKLTAYVDETTGF